MAEPIPKEEQSNYETFRECLGEPVLKALVMPAKNPSKKRVKRRMGKAGKASVVSSEGGVEEDGVVGDNDAEDLGEFIDYLSSLIFPVLPSHLRSLSYTIFKSSPQLQARYSIPLSTPTATTLLNIIPPSAIDSLSAYALLPPTPDPIDISHLFLPILTGYIAAVTAAPPVWSTTRTSACELCERSWIPLTYHHLIPRSTHERVRKRGWHPEEKLNSVAWLCRACHSFVHRLAGNEELAKGFWSVELIRNGGGKGEKREEVEGWMKWVAGVRWKSR